MNQESSIFMNRLFLASVLAFLLASGAVFAVDPTSPASAYSSFVGSWLLVKCDEGKQPAKVVFSMLKSGKGIQLKVYTHTDRPEEHKSYDIVEKKLNFHGGKGTALNAGNPIEWKSIYALDQNKVVASIQWWPGKNDPKAFWLGNAVGTYTVEGNDLIWERKGSTFDIEEGSSSYKLAPWSSRCVYKKSGN